MEDKQRDYVITMEGRRMDEKGEGKRQEKTRGRSETQERQKEEEEETGRMGMWGKKNEKMKKYVYAE